MIEISNASMRVLHEDLDSLDFGEFLCGRTFRLLATRLELLNRWDHVIKEIKQGEDLFDTLGSDPDYMDRLRAMGAFGFTLDKAKSESVMSELALCAIAKFSAEVGATSGLIETLSMAPFHDDEMKVEAINSINKILVDTVVEESSADSEIAKPKNNKKVFIVHGHDGALKSEMARVVDKLGLVPVILSEQANRGRTVIEKFEANSTVGYAIVLLTADDLGKSKSESDYKPRARQNIVLEYGYFAAKLGRNNIICIAEKGVELPSDIAGVIWVDKQNWALQLVKELKAAGYDVNADDLP